MLVPEHLIDLSCIENIDVKGRGGKEKEVSKLLPQWERVNKQLHDFEIEYQGVCKRLEVKKQRDLQWFDSGKYHNLSASDREITMLFINHKQGIISSLLATPLGNFIDWLCANRQNDGWTREVMEKAADFKKEFPSLQFKVKVNILSTFREYPKLFEIIYQRK